MKRILPAYPLWIIDPCFSVWSGADELNSADTMFWTGLKHSAYGLVRFGGKTYSFMGCIEGTERLEQTDVNVTAFSTVYNFKCGEFSLEVEFVSPLLPDDLKILSCPVCYTRYKISAKKLPDDFSVAVVLDENLVYDRTKAKVMGGVLPLKTCEAAFITPQRSLVLSSTNDNVAPEWGSVYVCGDESFFFTRTALLKYIESGKAEYIRKDGEDSYAIALSKTAEGCFMTAYDDFVSVFYFGEWLKGYFFKDGATIVDAINYSAENRSEIFEKCAAFDKKLKDDCDKAGKDYYLLCCAALRQSVGAHKLVENKKGELLFLSRECDSNSCIGTVDVSYPSIPLFLLYNPELVNAMMNGIFGFSRLDVWTFDFAPHDLGTYPWCSGQVYGVYHNEEKYGCTFNEGVGDVPSTRQMLYLRPAASNVYDEKYQMPVEECGNLLIMTAASCLAGGDIKIAENNFDLLSGWVTYLERFGLKPDTQLCTDDFAGHLKDNINLAIKALVGIEAFSIICKLLKKDGLAKEYRKKAETFAAELKKLSGGGIMPLTYGNEGTYSLKYNLLFDKLFGFDLFSQEEREAETAYYITKNNRYGVPLDTRKDYTKSDWILWTAALTDDKEKSEKLYAPVVEYLKSSPVRLPFGDWYDTVNGKIEHFCNRTVQGGIFSVLLKNSGKLKSFKD